MATKTVTVTLEETRYDLLEAEAGAKGISMPMHCRIILSDAAALKQA